MGRSVCGDKRNTSIRTVSCSRKAGFGTQAPLPNALQRENPACKEGSRYESRRKKKNKKKKLSPQTLRTPSELTSPVLPPCLSFGTRLRSHPRPGFLLPFVFLPLFIPPMFIVVYEPTLLSHAGDATVREKTTTIRLRPSEGHGS